MKRPSFLYDPGLQLILFGGKGGVGKTTCAAAAALYRAARSPQVSHLLVSVDPAHSLADSLAGLAPPPNLTVLELDAPEHLARFRAAHVEHLREIASAGTFLDGEDIHRFLDLSLPGVDELAAFLEISAWLESRAYDCILVDTAPSGHTLRLLAVPALLRQWMDMLDVLLAKRRYLREVFTRRPARDPLDQLLDTWNRSLDSMDGLLREQTRSRFVPVTIAEPAGVRETLALLRQLRHWGISAPDVIVNQLHPAGACAACDSAYDSEQREIARLSEKGASALWGVNLFPQEVRGRDLLSVFWDHAEPAPRRFAARPEAPAAAPWHVESAAQVPPAGLRLLVFSGKGGVGKTTLACAAALRLARDFPRQRILLLSTDPAHSLSACLGSVILPSSLAVLEIDAKKELRALKTQYAKEIRRVIATISGRLDLTFDRVVLERLMDLVPPGLDEIMALTRIIDLLVHGRYDLFVIDSAATGHLIRLLELPDIIDQWLKAFFAIFIKYQKIFELPGFSQQLVDLSKNLKQLRQVLRDPACSALSAVSIPTRMALEEARDLVAACGRTGIAVSGLILNLLTPAGDCRLCSTLRDRERDVVAAFRQAFPSLPLTLVERRQAADPESLEQLAGVLYREALAHALA